MSDKMNPCRSGVGLSISHGADGFWLYLKEADGGKSGMIHLDVTGPIVLELLGIASTPKDTAPDFHSRPFAELDASAAVISDREFWAKTE